MLLGEGHGMGSWEEEGMGGRAAKHSQNLDVSYTLFFRRFAGSLIKCAELLQAIAERLNKSINLGNYL